MRPFHACFLLQQLLVASVHVPLSSFKFVFYNDFCHSSKGPASAFKACGEAEKEEHGKTCQKHLEHLADSAVSTGSTDWYQQVMTDCIFDLCRGGDETSAELAAEIFSF